MEDISELSDLTLKSKIFIGIVFANGKDRIIADFRNQLRTFGRKIRKLGTIAFPHESKVDIEKCLSQLREKQGWTDAALSSLHLSGQPFMIVIDTDFSCFSPQKDPWAICKGSGFLRWQGDKRNAVLELFQIGVAETRNAFSALRTLRDRGNVLPGSIVFGPPVQ